MRDFNQKWIKLGAAGIIVAGLVTYAVWPKGNFEADPPVEAEPVVVDTVDRGLSEEQIAMFRTRIAELEATDAENKANGKEDINLLLTVGNLYYQIGELEVATGWYRSILELYPEDAAALENLAQAQIEMGDYLNALASLQAAANVSAYEPTYMKIADILDEHYPENQGEIRTVLETAIANLGQTSGLLARLGRWYADQGMLDEAISHYQVAHQIDPDDQAVNEALDRLKAERAAEDKKERNAGGR